MEKIKQFLFINTSIKQTIAKNTFWLFLSETSGRILKMGLVIYAARMLGVTGWGIFSYAISVSSLLMIFSDIGIGDLVMREMAKKKKEYQTFISTALMLKIIILLVSTLLVIFISPFISHIPEARTLFPIVALVLFFDSMRELGLSINRASEKMERDMVVKTITNAVIFVLGIILLKIKLTPESVAIAYAVGSAIGFIVIAIIIRKEIKPLISKIDNKLFKLVIKTTWPFALITLIGTILGNVDIYMLGIWKNSAEIGLYTSVQRIQQFIIIIPSTIAIAVFPLMARLANTDNKQFKMILEKTLSLIMLIGLPASLGGIILAGQLVPLIFGQGYLGAIPILRILMLMLLISFPIFSLSNAIVAYNKQKKLVLAYLFGIIVNIILNIILVPKFGAVGSAITSFFSTTIITYIIWRELQFIQPFSVLSKLKKIVLASVIMACVVVLFGKMGIPVVLNIVIAILFYFGTLIFLKEPLMQEIKTMIHL